MRLKRLRTRSSEQATRHFNPTRVRLKRSTSTLTTSPTRYFNPTRVRLKQHEGEWASLTDALQPHKGASETTIHFIAMSEKLTLQPHKGASETAIRSNTGTQDELLQPHKGASETSEVHNDTESELDFNPTRVRLKP